MLSDSHCHLNCLNLKNYNNNLCDAISAARKKDVKYMLIPSINMQTFSDILQIVSKDPFLFAAIGVHPIESSISFPIFENFFNITTHEKIIAVGETGLDFNDNQINDNQGKQLQIDLFKLHIQVAKKLNKPLIIHSRQAAYEVIKILSEENASDIGGVFHCFNGDIMLLKKILDIGFHVSFSGIVTFNSAKNLTDVIKYVPKNKILIETDSPYLAPVPFRGKPNEPSYLPYIALYLANLLNMSLNQFAYQTTKNFLKLFKIKI